MIWKLVLGVLLLHLLTLELISLVYPAAFAMAQQQEQQQQYTFVTQWGAEGSVPGQFMGHNDVVPSSDVTSWGSEGEGEGQFLGPEGIDVDFEGNVYVADTGNFRIQVFRPE